MRRDVLRNAPMWGPWNYVWYQIWIAVYYVFTGTFLTRWHYERMPVGQWVTGQFVWSTPPAYSLAPTYPTDLSGVPPLDALNFQRVIAVYDAVVPLISSYLANGDMVLFDVWLLRPPDIPDAVVFRFDIYYFPGPEFLRVDIGQVVSLPFALRAGVRAGGKSMMVYANWMLEESGMDDEARAALFEVRDGLRPWVYGASLVPVPNDGHPGLLELHRQVTGSEDLGVYHQPTLRDLVGSGGRCLRELVGRRVWVKVSVSGNRPGAGDSRLPHGSDEWVHNHYGQVRLSWRYPSEIQSRYSEWRWIRTRESVELFTIPWVDGQVPDLKPQYRRFNGLSVTVEVLAGGATACDAEG